MLKMCKGCGLMFLPHRSEDQRCGQCSRPRPVFDRKPIDLYLQWADRDPC